MMAHTAPLLSAPARDDADDAALIAAALTRWPDMARYAATARVTRGYDAQRDEWRDAVTVTVFEKTMDNYK